MLQKKDEIKDLMLFAKNATTKKDALNFAGRFAVAQLDDECIHVLLLDILKEKSHIRIVRPIVNELLRASRIDATLKCMDYLKKNKNKTFTSLMRGIPIKDMLSQNKCITKSDGTSLAQNWNVKFTLDNVRSIREIYLGKDQLANTVRENGCIPQEVELAIRFICNAMENEQTIVGQKEIINLAKDYLVPLLRNGKNMVYGPIQKRTDLVMLFLKKSLSPLPVEIERRVVEEVIVEFPDFWLVEEGDKHAGVRRSEKCMSRVEKSPFLVALRNSNTPNVWWEILECVAERTAIMKEYLADAECYLLERRNDPSLNSIAVWNENRLLKKIAGETKSELVKVSMAL